ncbi:MAG TPA: ABC transporter permease subunit [Actinoallomurus sp.]|nr:ABC transporter permease subunit [Actinoallomurus sp.]
MTAGTSTVEREDTGTGRDGFARLVRAEWTKFHTVRGWVIGMVAAAGVIMGLGLSPGRQGSCGQNGPDSVCALPVGPGGQEVTDNFTFVRRPLAGDGGITVRVTSLTGLLPTSGEGTRPGLVPWAKAGIIIKDGTRRGSAYAAIMVTGAHGVRMQDDYTHDTAGPPGGVSVASPRWLRLTRSGDDVSGYASSDGTHWARVGTARLAGLPATVQAGPFATSPQYTQVINQPLSTGEVSGPSQATAALDHVTLQGAWPAATWTGDETGAFSNASPLQRGGFQQTAGGFTVTGSGDIAPAVPGAAGLGTTITQTLVGTFAGLIAMVVVATMFITAEYRRGLVRTTLTASPRRGRILAAKAVVIAAVTFVTGLAGAAVVVVFGPGVLRANGVYVHATTTFTEVRLVVGTAALLAVAAVLALALGMVVRRGVIAVTAAVVVIVLPYLLAITGLPTGAARWLLRITPASAFAVQQSTPQYSQVDNVYTPVNGYFPLAPWAGFAVLCAWAALALGLAVLLFRRRDA